MDLAEMRASRWEAAFPRAALSKGKRCSDSFRAQYIWRLLAAGGPNPAELHRGSSAAPQQGTGVFAQRRNKSQRVKWRKLSLHNTI